MQLLILLAYGGWWPGIGSVILHFYYLSWFTRKGLGKCPPRGYRTLEARVCQNGTSLTGAKLNEEGNIRKLGIPCLENALRGRTLNKSTQNSTLPAVNVLKEQHLATFTNREWEWAQRLWQLICERQCFLIRGRDLSFVSPINLGCSITRGFLLKS